MPASSSCRAYSLDGRSFYHSQPQAPRVVGGYARTTLALHHHHHHHHHHLEEERPLHQPQPPPQPLSKSARISTLSLVESVSELRSKYSPSNYVPAVLRQQQQQQQQQQSPPMRAASISSDALLLPAKVADCNNTPAAAASAAINCNINNNHPAVAKDQNGNEAKREEPKAEAAPAEGLEAEDVQEVDRCNGARPGLAEKQQQHHHHHPAEAATPHYHHLSQQQRLLVPMAKTSANSTSSVGGLNGLKNIGNTCFMNSVLQCLSNTRYLLEYVRHDGYAHDINTSISSMKGALIKAFSQVIQELWSSEATDRVVNTVSLKSQIQRFAPRFMGYSQQDAQEFLRYLLEGLHEDVNRVTVKPAPILTEIDEKLSDGQKATESWQRYLRMDNSRVVDIFVGQLKSSLRCTHCGHCSVTFDPFWDLSLPLPQKQGPLRLQQCLDHFTREETLDGDEKPTCSKCQQRRKCTKSFSVQKFPKILVIQRFRGKLNILVDFPLSNLDLSAYSANKNVASECVYNLYAISNHSGTTYSGHYTAYCKHPYTGAWHEYNDSRVSSIPAKSVVSSEAYVLFYELTSQHSHL